MHQNAASTAAAMGEHTPHALRVDGTKALSYGSTTSRQHNDHQQQQQAAAGAAVGQACPASSKQPQHMRWRKWPGRDAAVPWSAACAALRQLATCLVLGAVLGQLVGRVVPDVVDAAAVLAMAPHPAQRHRQQCAQLPQARVNLWGS